MNDFFFKISANPSSFSSNNIFLVLARTLLNFLVCWKNSTLEKITYLWVESKMLNIFGATKNLKTKPYDSAFHFLLRICSWKNSSRGRQTCYQILIMLQELQLMWANKNLHESFSGTSNDAVQSFSTCCTLLLAPVTTFFGDHDDCMQHFQL